MKKLLSYLIILLIANTHMQAATYTVGAGGNYTSLYAAFDDINNGNITGDIELQITSNLVEANACQLDFSGFGGSYTRIKIYPTAPNLSVTGSFWPGHLIYFNGADNVTIDGRVNATGTTPSLKIAYTGSSSAGNSVIYLGNNSQHNTIQYCHIYTNAYDMNLITFENPQDNLGNSYNKIADNIIEGASVPGIPGQWATTLTGIISATANTATANNHYDTIVNNKIFNLRNHAILLQIGASAWYIANNSIYDNLGNDESAENRFFYGIKTEGTNANALGGITVVNNYIGGSAPMCGGSAFSLTNINNHAKSFTGISVNVSNPVKAIIEGNTIQNVLTDYSLAANPFTGIYTVGKSVIQNNIIGGSNGSVSNLHGVNNPKTTGINASEADSSLIINNQVSGFTTSSNTGSDAPEIIGIICDGAFTTNYAEIKNNIVGHTTTVNSIHNNCWTYSTGIVSGIVVNIFGYVKVENNTVANVKNNSQMDGSYLYGLNIIKAAGGSIVSHNFINDLVGSRILKGMRNVGHPGTLGKTITYNTIYNLSTTYTGTAVTYITGIDAKMQFAVGIQKTKQNFIHSLSSVNGNSLTTGIDIQNATAGSEILNNIVSIKSDSGDVYGVSMDNNVYSKFIHNTIYIQSNVARNKRTACLYVHNNIPEIISNNIFFNGMANASGVTKNHFCIYNQSNSNLTTANYNVYRVANQSAGGAVAYWNNTASAYNNLAQWKFITNLDTNSVTIDPQFTNAGGVQAADYYPNANVVGATYLGVSTDYFNNNRLSAFWMGALQSTGVSTALPLIWNLFTATLNNRNETILTWETAAEENTMAFEIEKSIDAINWNTLHIVQASGNKATETRYSSSDNEVGLGTTYYRIKQIDWDHHFSYSDIREVTRMQNSSIEVYPNPANMFLHIQLPTHGITQINIFNITGNPVYSTTIYGSEKINISNLPAGQYILQTESEAMTASVKFLKQ